MRKKLIVFFCIILTLVANVVRAEELPELERLAGLSVDEITLIEEYSGWSAVESDYSYVVVFTDSDTNDEHRYVFNDDMTSLENFVWHFRSESWEGCIERFDLIESELISKYGNPTLSFADVLRIETESSLLNNLYSLTDTLDPNLVIELDFHKYDCWETKDGMQIEMISYRFAKGEDSPRNVAFPMVTTNSMIVTYNNSIALEDQTEDVSSRDDEEYLIFEKDKTYSVDGISEFSFDIARVTSRMISTQPGERYSAEIMLPEGKKAVDIVFKYKNLRNTSEHMQDVASGTMTYKNSYEYEAEMIFETLNKGSFMSEIIPLSEEHLHVYFVVPEDVWSDITGTIEFKINVDGILLQGSLDNLL